MQHEHGVAAVHALLDLLAQLDGAVHGVDDYEHLLAPSQLALHELRVDRLGTPEDGTDAFLDFEPLQVGVREVRKDRGAQEVRQPVGHGSAEGRGH